MYACALDGLASVVGEDQARKFLRTFIDMWPGRRARLHEAVARCDADAAKDVALSIKSSASMAGAHHLADRAHRLHETASQGHGDTAWEACAELLPEIDALASRALEDLAALALRVEDE